MRTKSWLKWSTINARPICSRRGRLTRLGLEPLEDRTLLSTILWTNRGTAANDSDGFAGVFGANAELARRVVDGAIHSWEGVIENFNYADGTNTFRLTVNMDAADTRLDASAGPTGQLQGKPVSGAMRIGRGNDTSSPPDKIGDGGGYFLDPTPQEHSEFLNTINNAFSGRAGSASPAVGLSDLYSLVL